MGLLGIGVMPVLNVDWAYPLILLAVVEYVAMVAGALKCRQLLRELDRARQAEAQHSAICPLCDGSPTEPHFSQVNVSP